MSNLDRAFETDNGLIVDGVVAVDSLLALSMSEKPTYSGDNISSLEYFNSLTQVDANRIMKVDLVYSSDSVSTETWLIYKSDGTTVYQTITRTYTYTGDVVTNIEEAVT